MMPTVPPIAPEISPPREVSGDLISEQTKEWLLRGYFAVKSLCLRLDLPVDGEFFNACMTGFARSTRLSAKLSGNHEVDFLAAVAIYRQSLSSGFPVFLPKMLELLCGARGLGSFHEVFLKGYSCPHA